MSDQATVLVQQAYAVAVTTAEIPRCARDDTFDDEFDDEFEFEMRIWP